MSDLAEKTTFSPDTTKNRTTMSSSSQTPESMATKTSGVATTSGNAQETTLVPIVVLVALGVGGVLFLRKFRR